MTERLTPAWTTFRPHPIQRAAWTDPCRFVAIPAGRGSGKTEMAKRRLVRFLPVKKPWDDPKYFYGAPTQEQARRIVWESLQKLIPPHWEPRAVGNRIRTKFGSEIWVIGLDKPQRLEGVQWDGCVLDESCDLRPDTFDLSILPALTHRSGWCWRIGVPKRQGPGAADFRDFFERAAAGKIPGASGYTWPSSDILSPEQLQYAKDNLDTKDYLEQFDAKFQRAGGGIFYSFDEEYNVRPCGYNPNMTLMIGSDFNVDPMCWAIGHRFPDRIEWVDEIFKRNTNTEATLEILYGRYSDHKAGFEFYGDASSAARKTSASQSDYRWILNHEGFKKLGRTVHYPKANPLVQDRFSACNAMFCNAAGKRRMFIDPRCKRLIDDVRARYYKPGTREPSDGGDLGHMTDAMGYPVFRLFPIKVRLEYETRAVFTLGGS